MAALELVVTAEQAGRTVKSLLRGELGLSAGRVGRLKRTETGLTVNGTRVFTSAVLQEGDRLEIFYSPAGGEGASQKVIAANKLLPAEGVYYNGILVEKGEREDGSVDLVMVPLDTPSESWGDPMRQFVFHTGESTQFRLAPEALKEGALLNIYHKGIATRSLPPQGVALEVRLLESGA